MTNITTVYDAFSGILKFYMDGQPLPGISQFSKFQQRPFSQWCREIFSVAYEEMNDDYAMTYVGRGCESRILAYYSKKESHCRCFSTKVPAISDSALKRLKKLHMLCMNGLMYKRRTWEIAVLSDLPEKEIQSLLKQALPKLCYCIFQIRCLPLSQWSAQKEPFFVLTSENGGRIAREMLGNCTVEHHLIIRSDQTRFCGIEGNTYIDAARENDFLMVLQDDLEFRLFPDILKKMMREIQLKDTSHPQYYNFWALDKVEPSTIPVFPLSMEFGQSKEIERKTIPEGFMPEELQYRVSSEEILKIQNHVMQAVGSGEVLVEAFLPGQTVRVASASIKVVRRNRIKTMKMTPDCLEMCVGDTARVGYHFQPQDADNTSTVKLQSVNGTVASVKQSGDVEARKPGSTRVFAVTDDNVKAACDIKVYPRLEEIGIALERNTIRCGEYCSVEIKRVPETATLDPLLFSVEPAGVAEYDAGSKIIVTKKPGKAVLTVTDKRHSVVSQSSFTVKKKGLFR